MKNPNCTLCELHKTCKRVCIAGIGSKPCRIMFVGEAPGASEDLQGKPFVGEAGQVFDRMLQTVGMERKDVFVTNIVCCRPPNNRVPTNDEMAACAPYLEEEIAEVRPEIIVPMGNTATQYFLGMKGITKLAGREFVSEKFHCKIIPLLHPANILRVPEHFNINVGYLRKIKNVLDGGTAQPVKYVVADTWDKVLTLFKRLREVPEFSVDVETTGFDFLTKEILCVGFSWKETTAVILPLLGYKCREVWAPEQKVQIITWLKEIMEGPAKKILQNGSFDYKFFKHLGITIANFDFDTMLMHHLLDENAKGFHGLDSLALLYTDMGNYDAELEKYKLELTQSERLERAKLIKAIKKDADIDDEDKEEMIEELKAKPLNFSYADIPEQVLWKYLGCDADATFRVKNCLLDLLKQETLEKLHIFPEHRDKSLLRVLAQIVMPLRNVLTEMEYHGTLLDIAYLKKLDIEYTQKIKEINEEFAKTVEVQQAQTLIQMKLAEKFGAKYDNLKVKRGTREEYIAKYAKKMEFNLNSAIQLRVLLFEVLKLKPIDFSAKTNEPSTGKKTLAKYAKKSEFVARLLENRHFQKFHKTYVIGMQSLVDANGRIHTDFNSHGTKTGRLSSSNPNLQNIPRDGEIKKAFIVPEGYVLVQFDFSQAEFRCWANYATLNLSDKMTSRIFKEISQGMDIHKRTAADFWGIPIEQVTKDQRTAAKFVVFGLMYGRGAKSVAEQVGITEKEAEQIINQFFEKYPDARQWLEATKAFCMQMGYVIQQFGRIRRLPTVFSADKEQRAEALRQAVNMPIQGAAADITGLCLVRIWKKIKELGLKAFPILTVHDSLIFEVPENEVKQFIPIGYGEMTRPVKGIAIPMDAEIQVGKNWKEMVQYTKDGDEIKKEKK